jgi:hypothetical protein
MKTYWGIGDITPRNLNLDTRWRWVVSFTPRGRAPGTHWMGPRPVLDAVVKWKIPSPRRESNRGTHVYGPAVKLCLFHKSGEETVPKCEPKKTSFVLVRSLHPVYGAVYVMWLPCHHGMASRPFEDGGDGPQIWRVAANVLNKQSKAVGTGLSCCLGAGRGALLTVKYQLVTNSYTDTYSILVGKHEGKRTLGWPRHRWENKLEWILAKYGDKLRTGCI